jgi:hypothetical protein
VVRQDALVEHVRIADDDVAVEADRLALVARRIAIEGGRAQAQVARAIEFDQLGHLVLRERLGGEQVQRLRLPGHGGCDDRKGVAETLAGGRGRGDDEVFATLRGVPGFALVGVELRHAAGAQGAGEFFREVGGEFGIATLAPGQHEVPCDQRRMFPGESRGEQPPVKNAWCGRGRGFEQRQRRRHGHLLAKEML